MADHTETIEVEFDPNKTNYGKLLKIFWSGHDSTACHSRQYMSAIFYHDEEQQKLAEQTKEQHQKQKMRKIQTRILPAKTFWLAENYHQKYILRNSKNLLNSLNMTDSQIITSYIATRLNGYLAGYGSEDQFYEDLPNLGLNKDQEEYVVDAIGKSYPAR